MKKSLAVGTNVPCRVAMLPLGEVVVHCLNGNGLHTVNLELLDENGELVGTMPETWLRMAYNEALAD